MKLVKLWSSKINCKSLLLILIISTATFSRQKLFAQNILLLNAPISMNNIAGEINSFNIFQIVSNPANLESIKKFNIGFFSERKYNLVELNNHMVVSGFSLRKIKLGIIIQQAGSSKFNQYSLGLCLSKKIRENTSLAIQSSLLKNNFSKYANQQYISAQLGLVTHLSKTVKFGFTATNFMSFNKQTSLDNAYSINIATGLCYDISKQFSMQLNCSKTSNLTIVFSGLVKYQVHKKIALKLGVVSNTNATNIELAHSGKKMNWALIFAFHPNLGITSGSSISNTNE
jgi:hypothetical protein